MKATLEMALEALTNPSTIAVSHAIELIKAELAKREMPTKIFGPNLEQILNAAGFYRRDAVCCGDYEKCIEPCTPKGEWLAKKELAKPEPNKPCKCMDEFWCNTFDRCKRNE